MSELNSKIENAINKIKKQYLAEDGNIPWLNTTQEVPYLSLPASVKKSKPRKLMPN